MLFGRLRCLVCSTHGKSVTWNHPKWPGISFEGFEAMYKHLVMYNKICMTLRENRDCILLNYCLFVLNLVIDGYA
jgi:hypothetical protein